MNIQFQIIKYILNGEIFILKIVYKLMIYSLYLKLDGFLLLTLFFIF